MAEEVVATQAPNGLIIGLVIITGASTYHSLLLIKRRGPEMHYFKIVVSIVMSMKNGSKSMQKSAIIMGVGCLRSATTIPNASAGTRRATRLKGSSENVWLSARANELSSVSYISGEKGPGNASPPADVTRESVKLFGRQFMGRETFQNLMAWEETFSPSQRKEIEVDYEIEIPLQETKMVRKKVKGNYKGVWPQEANSVPVQFLQRLAPGHYYFFDYYLTSGASWAGPIAFEDVTLHFDQWWRDLEFYSTIKQGKLGWSNRTLYPGLPITATYMLRDEEPTENIYFAIRPGKNN